LNLIESIDSALAPPVEFAEAVMVTERIDPLLYEPRLSLRVKELIWSASEPNETL
jgi:hypothetical protein